LHGSKEKELYAQIVLILFKPFRNVEDLLKINNTTKNHNWWLAYKHYEFDLKSKAIISNLQDYHTCKDRAASKHFDSTSEPLVHINCADNTPDFSDQYEALISDFPHNITNNIKEIHNPVLFPSTGKYIYNTS